MKNNFLSKIKVVVVSSLLLVNTAFACINDVDTRFFESQNFPDVYELIQGNFTKNAPELYAWRIQDRLKKIEKEPNNPAYYDDLSVAYEKTGQTQKAIELMEKVYTKYPNRYETIANLGTFYIHNKQYAKGLELLKKAIVINPDAHFGREIYQIKVVEYFLKENPDGKITLPIQKGKYNFADFILKDLPKDLEDINENKKVDEILKATVGIGGMLKFGNSDSPILLEAMGDLYAYLDNHHNTYRSKDTTQFGKIAILSYAAAINHYINNINEKSLGLQQFEKYLKVKNLSTTSSFDGITRILQTGNIEDNIKKNEFKEKQLAIIAKGGDVEKNIHNQLYPESQSQEELIVLAQKNYEKMLDSSKQDYYQFLETNKRNLKNIMETIFYFFSIILGGYILVNFPSILSFLYNIQKKNDVSQHPVKTKKVLFNIFTIIFVYLLINTMFIYRMIYSIM